MTAADVSLDLSGRCFHWHPPRGSVLESAPVPEHELELGPVPSLVPPCGRYQSYLLVLSAESGIAGSPPYI